MKLLPFFQVSLPLFLLSLLLGILAFPPLHISSFPGKFLSILKNPPLLEALHNSLRGIIFFSSLPVDFYTSHFRSTLHKLCCLFIVWCSSLTNVWISKKWFRILLDLIVLAPFLLSALCLVNQSFSVIYL